MRSLYLRKSIIFFIESVPAYVGGQIFLPFFETTVPKCTPPVGIGEEINFSKNFSEKARKRVCIWIPLVQISERDFQILKYFPI